MLKKKFSIITVCKNEESNIERTIKSAISQTYEDIEYIVIDGGSTDNTCSIINGYIGKIDCFISEADNGIYEAMNKGIKKANGDIISFLNSGDLLFNEEVIQNVNKSINKFQSDNIDVFHGNILMYYNQTGDGYIWKSGPINRFTTYRGSIPHPSTFYKKKAFEKNGLFNQNYKIAGDYEWVVRGLLLNRLVFQYIGIIAAIFYQGGISNSPEFLQIQKEEKRELLLRILTNPGDFYFQF